MLSTELRLFPDHHQDSSVTCRARNEMQRCGLGLMVGPETARVSLCPTQAPSSRKPGLFFESRPRRVAVERADMSTTRTHFTFRVDTWTADGESIVEHVAGIEDYQVALATLHAPANLAGHP